jgi:hypothetical protein
MHESSLTAIVTRTLPTLQRYVVVLVDLLYTSNGKLRFFRFFNLKMSNGDRWNVLRRIQHHTEGPSDQIFENLIFFNKREHLQNETEWMIRIYKSPVNLIIKFTPSLEWTKDTNTN